MTLLTLEEIEKAEEAIVKIFCSPNPSSIALNEAYNKLDSLLALGRAYWELSSKPKGLANKIRAIQDSEPLTQEQVDSAISHAHNALVYEEDKPHSATIRAIVEALEAGREFADLGNGRDAIVFNSYEAIKSLEKHLE